MIMVILMPFSSRYKLQARVLINGVKKRAIKSSSRMTIFLWTRLSLTPWNGNNVQSCNFIFDVQSFMLGLYGPVPSPLLLVRLGDKNCVFKFNLANLITSVKYLILIKPNWRGKKGYKVWKEHWTRFWDGKKMSSGWNVNSERFS